MLEIKNLSKKFGRKKAVDNVSFVFENKTYGLLGPNGAGKTTLLRCITRLYSVDKSSVVFDDNMKIGYLPQKFGMFKDLKVREALELFGNLKGVTKQELPARIDTALELVILTEKKEEKVRSLSGGMLRRLGIAQAILDDPPVLIFDEPTAGLDPEERIRFKNILLNLKRDRLIIISTHIVEDVQMLCDEIIIMKNGKIAANGSREAIMRPAQGHCFTVEKEKADLINGEYTVQRELEYPAGTYLKILCEKSQQLSPCEVGLEDGYIWALKYGGEAD